MCSMLTLIVNTLMLRPATLSASSAAVGTRTLHTIYQRPLVAGIHLRGSAAVADAGTGPILNPCAEGGPNPPSSEGAAAPYLRRTPHKPHAIDHRPYDVSCVARTDRVPSSTDY